MFPWPLAAAIAALGAVVVALGPGYVWWLRSLPRPADAEPADPPAWPEVDVVLPVHNEAPYIAEKIRNLRALDYPEDRIRFWIVDGASTDGTPALAARDAAGDERFTVADTPAASKSAQVNRALASCRAPWVLVTDVDCLLAPDTLRRLVRKGESDPLIAAVGATVVPAAAHAGEALHWAVADNLRVLEGAHGATSIVTGPCYIFRRDVMPSFAPGVVADDAHAAFRCAAAGRRVCFVPAVVSDVRSPHSLAEMVPHKYRKARAYLREIVRFFPRIGSMHRRARQVFLWHAAQMIAGPPAAVALGAAMLAFVVAAGPWAWGGAAAASAVFLADRRRRTAAGLSAVLVIALLAAVLSLPFPQRPAYAKVDARRASSADAGPS